MIMTHDSPLGVVVVSLKKGDGKIRNFGLPFGKICRQLTLLLLLACPNFIHQIPEEARLPSTVGTGAPGVVITELIPDIETHEGGGKDECDWAYDHNDPQDLRVQFHFAQPFC